MNEEATVAGRPLGLECMDKDVDTGETLPEQVDMMATRSEHGTRARYYWHLYHGEEPCDSCRQANRDYNEARRRARGVQPLLEFIAEWKAKAELDHPHGTWQAGARHYKRGETPCEACRLAYNAYYRERRKVRRNT